MIGHAHVNLQFCKNVGKIPTKFIGRYVVHMRCQICVFSLYSAEQSTFVVCFDDDDADRHNHDLRNNDHDHLNNIIIIIIEWSASPDFLLNNEFAASFGFFSARQTWSAIYQPKNINNLIFLKNIHLKKFYLCIKPELYFYINLPAREKLKIKHTYKSKTCITSKNANTIIMADNSAGESDNFPRGRNL